MERVDLKVSLMELRVVNWEYFVEHEAVISYEKVAVIEMIDIIDIIDMSEEIKD